MQCGSIIFRMSGTKSLNSLYPKRIDIPILTAVSGILLLIGLAQPVITVQKLWDSNTQSILSSVINLWKDTDYFLAAVIFFFSMIFPIFKLFSLFALWFIPLRENTQKTLVGMLEMLGRWSMLDVFVCAVLIVTLKLGALASAKIEDGIYYFAVSIFLAMTVSELLGRLIRKQ